MYKLPGTHDTDINFDDSDLMNGLQSLMSVSNMSMDEALHEIKMRIERQQILSLHKRSIHQNAKDKRWYTRLPNGKQIARKKRRDLDDFLIKYYTDYAAGAPECTLSILYSEWLEKRRFGKKSDNTVARDIRLWNYYLKDSAIANMPINDITRADFRNWAEDIIVNYNMTLKYYKNVKTLMNLLLGYAEEKELLERNKFTGMKIDGGLFRAPAKHEHGQDSFSVDEEYAIMKEAELDAAASCSALPLGVCILLLTGVRVGELAALKYGDIKNNMLHIRRMQVEKNIIENGVVKRKGCEVVEHAKSQSGNRVIPLPNVAVEYFDLIKQYNIKNGYSVSDDDYIFQRKGKLATNRCFDHRIRKYCKNAGLEYIKSCHDGRRTYITKLAEHFSLDSLKELAGHSTIDMTLKYLRNNDTPEYRAQQVNDAFKDYKCNEK